MAILWISNTTALNAQASSVRKLNGLPCLCPTFDYSAEANLGGMKSYLFAAGTALRFAQDKGERSVFCQEM